MMYYPKNYAPNSQYEQLSILYNQLAAAYSIIAQYEEADRRRESERLRERLVDFARSTSSKLSDEDDEHRQDIAP